MCWRNTFVTNEAEPEKKTTTITFVGDGGRIESMHLARVGLVRVRLEDRLREEVLHLRLIAQHLEIGTLQELRPIVM